MVGADVAMMTSAVLRNGPAHFAAVEADLRLWMERHEYTSVDQLRGSASQDHTDDPSAFERNNYMKTLHSWSGPAGLSSRSEGRSGPAPRSEGRSGPAPRSEGRSGPAPASA